MTHTFSRPFMLKRIQDISKKSGAKFTFTDKTPTRLIETIYLACRQFEEEQEEEEFLRNLAVREGEDRVPSTPRTAIVPSNHYSRRKSAPATTLYEDPERLAAGFVSTPSDAGEMPKTGHDGSVKDGIKRRRITCPADIRMPQSFIEKIQKEVEENESNNSQQP